MNEGQHFPKSGGFTFGESSQSFSLSGQKEKTFLFFFCSQENPDDWGPEVKTDHSLPRSVNV